MRRFGPTLAAFTLTVLGGCRLIDQRTFEAKGAMPSSSETARSSALAQRHAARPLVSVFPGRLDHDWAPDVLAAVRDALVRQPAASFDVIAPYPTAKGGARQSEAIRTGSADAAAVATVIEADGVSADRLHLGARGDAGDPGREVMVFLR